MSIVSSARIARLRATAARALPDTCTIQRRTTISDGGGGTTTTWTDHLTNVPCRIAPTGGGETGTTAGRIADETTHVITLRAGTDITSADRLIIDGTTYDMTAVRTRGAMEITRRAEVREAP